MEEEREDVQEEKTNDDSLLVTLLDNYSNAKRAVEDHIEANKTLFDAHQSRVMRVIDAENALRDAVAQKRKGATNGEYTVTITPQSLEICDFSKLDELIAAGTIPNIRNLIVYKQERPARINITANR